MRQNLKSVCLRQAPYFHGAVEREEAEQRLRGRADGALLSVVAWKQKQNETCVAGCYLVRFGGKAEHPFTVSVLVGGQVQHKRVHHVWGSKSV